MKGQPPKPTVLKKLQGNPGKKALPKNEPQPRVSNKVPRAPSSLNKVAQKEWRRIVGELYTIGLLTEIDIAGLQAYCSCYAQWQDAQSNIQQHGVLMKSPTGFPMQSPYLAISNRAMVEMRKWLQEFGMTPSSRARVSAKPVKKDDPVEAFRKARLKRVK
jgi:P27 family predicted phage terminase small subunit